MNHIQITFSDILKNFSSLFQLNKMANRNRIYYNDSGMLVEYKTCLRCATRKYYTWKTMFTFIWNENETYAEWMHSKWNIFTFICVSNAAYIIRDAHTFNGFHFVFKITCSSVASHIRIIFASLSSSRQADEAILPHPCVWIRWISCASAPHQAWIIYFSSFLL